MLLNDGVLTVYTLEKVSAPGRMPVEQLVQHSQHYYGERTIGYNRQYAAMGVNQQVDMLVRIWYDKTIRIGMYAVDEDNDQYRIDIVQHLDDEDGLRVTDLSLSRLDSLYDISGA